MTAIFVLRFHRPTSPKSVLRDTLSVVAATPLERQNRNRRQMPQLFGSVYLSAGGSMPTVEDTGFDAARNFFGA
jgi:hypothetical protein